MEQLSTLLGDLNGGIILTVSWLFYAVIGVVTVVAAVLLFGISRNLNVLIEIAYAIREEFNAARGTTKMQHNISNALREVEDLIYENASELRQTRKEMASLRDALAFKSKPGEESGGKRPPAPQAPPPQQIAPPAPQQAAPTQPAPQPAPPAASQPAPQAAPQPASQPAGQAGPGYQRTDQPFATFDGAFPAAERSAARGKPPVRKQPSRPLAPSEPEAEVIETAATQSAPPPQPASRPQPAPPAQRVETPPPESRPEPRPEPRPAPQARPPASPPRNAPERPRGPVPLGVRPQARPPAPPPQAAPPPPPPSVPRAPAPPPAPPPRPPAAGKGPGGPGAGIVTTPDTKALRLSSAERAAKAPPKRVVRVLNTTVNPPDLPAAGKAAEAATTTPGPTTTAGPAEQVLRPPPEPEFTPDQRASGSRFVDKDEHNGAMSRLAALARKRDEERRGRPKGE